MKFNVSSKTLYTFVSAVSKVINSKNALTILNNFLFELSGDTLTVTASDLENTLVAHMEVMDAEGEGRFCVDARRLVDLLKEMPDQGLEFNINDQNLSVELTYATGNYSFIALNGSEYPSNEADAEASDANFSFVCPTEQVLKGIDNTLFAVGNDDLRPQMMGILWDVKPDHIVFVATDTRKLVKFTNSLVQPQCECSFILPLKPATVLKNVFAKEDSIKVTVSERNVRFESSSYIFDCRLIKGEFRHRVARQALHAEIAAAIVGEYVGIGCDKLLFGQGGASGWISDGSREVVGVDSLLADGAGGVLIVKPDRKQGRAVEYHLCFGGRALLAFEMPHSPQGCAAYAPYDSVGVQCHGA